jgi:putative hydrolase of the HAD superfamily
LKAVLATIATGTVDCARFPSRDGPARDDRPGSDARDHDADDSAASGHDTGDDSVAASMLAGVLRAVVFDVDFTLARPGPDLGPEGYRSLGLRYGLDLDPSRYEEARITAFAEVKRHPEFEHDEEIWVLFTERIIEGMGGRGDTYGAALEMERRWSQSVHFELFDDALPVLDALRDHGLKIGLLSNSSRDLDEFVSHHGLVVDAVLTSRVHGKTKPHRTIFRAILERLEVSPEEAVMVGDTVEDDFEGALAVGMRAVLIDREGRYPGVQGRLDDLRELPAALGLL